MMINLNHSFKVAMAWVSIVYVICFVGVALFPDSRPGFMRYGLHMTSSFGQNVLTLGTLISGLIIWNIVALLGVWLFVVLYNSIKK